MIKTIVWLVVVVVVGLGAWYFLSGQNSALSQTNTAPASETGQTPQAQVSPTPSTPQSSPDTSNAALEQDSASIDAQLQTATNDSAAVDQSLNDKPVQQTE